MDTKDPKLGQQTGEMNGKPTPPTTATRDSALPRGSQLICFGDRVTYTFIHGNEVGSIHFDQMRGEIFYKGHNVRHMELEEGPMQMLEKMRDLLKADGRTRRYADPYARVLDKIILEKKKAHSSSP